MNVILNIDIYRMMKNPFKPPRQRVSSYYIAIAIITVFLFSGAMTVYIYRYLYGVPWIQLEYDSDNKIDNTPFCRHFELMVISVFYPAELIIHFVVIYKIIQMLYRKGTSPRLMSAIRWRYLLFFVILLPFYIINAFQNFLFRDKLRNLGIVEPDERKEWFATLEVMSLVLMTLLCMIRFVEKFVLYTFMDII